MPKKIGDLINQYKQIEHEQRKQEDETIARIIVGFKSIKHMVYHLPKAYDEKKHDENSEYKSVIDYIEDPEFDYNQEVERISNKIEEKRNSLNEKTMKIQKFFLRMNPIYLAIQVFKKTIERIRANKVKRLPSTEQFSIRNRGRNSG